MSNVVRFDRAICIESQNSVEPIHHMQATYKDQIKGLTLAGEYMFIVASTEGAYTSGKEAAATVIDELK